MAQTVADEQKVRVTTANGAQIVRIPEALRFRSDEVFVGRDTATGNLTVSERPLSQQGQQKPSWQDIFDEIDAIGASDFVVERDRSLPRDIDFG